MATYTAFRDGAKSPVRAPGAVVTCAIPDIAKAIENTIATKMVEQILMRTSED